MIIFPQKETLHIEKDLYIDLDFNKKQFEIKHYKVQTSQNSDCVNIVNNSLLNGRLMKNKNNVYGFVNNKTFFILNTNEKFKYRILRTCSYFSNQHILYTCNFKSNNLAIQNMKWLNSVRNENWFFCDFKNNKRYIIKYYKGIVKDSIILH